MKISALVPTGHGINCELETRRALELAGFDRIDLVHLNFLANGEADPANYQMVVFPGGFLDGDDLGAAQACANRIRHSRINNDRLIDRLMRFVSEGGLLLGICNGFQLLIKLGMLPAINGDYTARDFTLTANDSGRFEDRWVSLLVDRKSPCIFTRGLSALYLPIRHGEGKIVGRKPDMAVALTRAHQATLRYASSDGSSPTMEYPYNPNGSEEAIAGVCDPSGRVFGLMPHPECFLHRTNHPRWTRDALPEDGEGLSVFKNAADFLRQA
ncbi:MAG: phosphoribosylformylglycinamidine synthase subunit PurQ [Desulfomonile sp.]|jgi:phosphoribosylformylglycinamidine synthase|nr:phosphoribosylformylglycinamidine synthase subunit PurQ [Deltaproteobacteria bacterium]